MNTPPLLAHKLLAFRIPPEHREYVMGDVDERFTAKVELCGLSAARKWYWRETVAAWTRRWSVVDLEFNTTGKGDGLMQTLLQDLRWAIKVLRSTPALSGAIVLTLALAIGANSTIFSWMNRVLLNPLPGVETSSLYEFSQVGPLGEFSLSYPDYLDYRKQATSTSLTGRQEFAMDLSTGDSNERIWGELVTDNYFDALGVRPALGRGLVHGDVAPGAPPVAIIGYGLWKRRFGGDTSIVGRSLLLNGQAVTIAGVAPEGFVGSNMGLSFDVFLPITMVESITPGRNRLQNRGNHWFQGMARIHSDVTAGQAREELNSISRGLAEIVPEYKEIRASLVPIRDSEKGGISILRPVLMAMMAVVALILLIACANIANLLLARATSRRKEIAIRLSMGATRGRLLRQLLTEGLVLAGAGAMGGLLVTWLCRGLLQQFAPPADLPIAMNVELDYRVLGFTLVMAVGSTLLFALIPALRLAGAQSSEGLKERSAGAGTRNRMRNGLVIVQVALSLALLVAAGLCVKSLSQIQSFNPGFNKEGVLLASIDLFPSGYDATTGPPVLRQLLDELQTIPGVSSFTLARHVPLGLTGLNSSSVQIDGYDQLPGKPIFASLTPVGPNYLGVMNIPLIAGRDILRSDDEEAPKVAVIAETMAKRYWPGKDAVGGRFRFGTAGAWVTVVGVAGDVKWRDVKEESRPFIYLPVLQSFHPSTVIHLRTAGDPMDLIPGVREAVRKVAPQLPVFAIRTLAGHVSASTFQQSIASRLLGAFGVLALTLSALGLYGVLAFLVGQRTREIGIRMALGAEPGDVFRMVVRQGLLLTSAGVLAGILAAYGLGRLMSGLLFGVTPSDPGAMIGGSTLLVLTAMAACMIPAYRATRVDPSTALRSE